MFKTILILAGLSIFLSGCALTERISSNSNDDTLDQPTGVTLPLVSSRLDLSNQGLTKIPSDVFGRGNLTELNVSGNQLTGAIQGEIRQLSKLTVLNASNNQMTGVPAEIGQLKNLQVLDLSNNELTGLPYELGNLQNLKTFNISGNNYSEQDLNIILAKLPPSVQVIK